MHANKRIKSPDLSNTFLQTQHDKVDFLVGIPFVNVRYLTKVNSFGFVSIFSYIIAVKLGSTAEGISCSMDISIDFFLKKMEKDTVINYLYRHGPFYEYTQQNYEGRSKRYVYIDKYCCKRTTRHLIDTEPNQNKFKWTMTMTNSGFDLASYHQRVRVQQFQHESSFYVNFTFADALFNLRVKYNCIILRSFKVIANFVVETNTGAGHYRTAFGKHTIQSELRFRNQL